MLTRYIDLYGKTLALFLVFEIPFRNTDLGTNTVRLVLRNGISKAKNRASVLPYKSVYRAWNNQRMACCFIGNNSST